MMALHVEIERMRFMKAVMYGAGNIGRGFIGQAMSRSGYEVVFVDVVKDVVEALNRRGSYPVRVVSNDDTHEETVEGVRAVDGMDAAAVAREIASADLMATAVGANILPRIAPVIAQGLKARFDSGAPPLNIIICENLLDANKLLKKWIAEALPQEYVPMLDTRVGFVEASIGRMVPVMTKDMQEGDILRVWVEPYDELPVDRDAFIGGVPALHHLQPFSPFEFYIERKLFIHNLGHATCAYFGFLKGYEFIWQAVSDADIRSRAYAVMSQSAAGLSGCFGVPQSEIFLHVEDLLSRFGNRALGDSVARVGRDPLRKLSPQDRLVGSVRLCKSQALPYERILDSLAAALLFHDPSDEASVRMAAMIEDQGVESFLKDWCRLDQEDIPAVVTRYQQLQSCLRSRVEI